MWQQRQEMQVQLTAGSFSGGLQLICRKQLIKGHSKGSTTTQALVSLIVFTSELHSQAEAPPQPATRCKTGLKNLYNEQKLDCPHRILSHVGRSPTGKIPHGANQGVINPR